MSHKNKDVLILVYLNGKIELKHILTKSTEERGYFGLYILIVKHALG